MGDDGDEVDDDYYEDDNGIPTHQMPRYYMNINPKNGKFHCFTVHFDSLSFIHTKSCTFSYNYVSIF